VDFIANYLFNKKITVSPTINIKNSSIRKGELLGVSGYAYPGNKVILNLDEINYSTTTPATGQYNFSINTSMADLGSHFARVKQVNVTTQQESDWSLTRNFEVLTFLTVFLDFNNDGIINISDWSIFLGRFGSKDAKIIDTIDFNQDKKIDISDFSIFLRNFKK
jgi:hypothetical protein